MFSIQYKFGSNCVVEPRIGYKTIVLRLSVLCVCPSAMTLKWHANSKYIVMQLDTFNILLFYAYLLIHAWTSAYSRVISKEIVRAEYR